MSSPEEQTDVGPEGVTTTTVTTVMPGAPPLERRSKPRDGVDAERAAAVSAIAARERFRLRRLVAIAATAASIAVATVVTALLLVIGSAREDANVNGRRIDALTAQVEDQTVQLEDARALLAANLDQENDIADCEAKLMAVARDGATATQIAMARLAILITSIPPNDRPPVANAAIDDMEAAIAEYDDAVTALNDWTGLPPDEQVTCPL